MGFPKDLRRSEIDVLCNLRVCIVGPQNNALAGKEEKVERGKMVPRLVESIGSRGHGCVRVRATNTATKQQRIVSESPTTRRTFRRSEGPIRELRPGLPGWI